MINRRTALFTAAASAAAFAVRAQDNPMPHGAPAGPPPQTDYDPALVALVNGPQRSAANKARDPWRHPHRANQYEDGRPRQGGKGWAQGLLGAQ